MPIPGHPGHSGRRPDWDDADWIDAAGWPSLPYGGGRSAGPGVDEGGESDAGAGSGSGWQASVAQAWALVAAGRGLDFEPPPAGVAAALPGLAATVEHLAAGMGGQDRRWLPAGLAALADHLERTTLPDPPALCSDGPNPDTDGR